MIPTIRQGLRPKRHLCWIAALTYAAFFSGISVQGQQLQGGCPSASCSAARQQTDKTGLYYAIGDQVKVSVAEPVDTAPDDHKTGGGLERSEFGGTYVIQADGRIYLPVIGPVEIADRSYGEAHELVSAAFKAATGHAGSIEIVLGEREPIYLIVAGAKAEAVKYFPGMTALHAIALGGGAAIGSDDYSRQAEAMRESERKDLGIQRLKRSLARRLVLRAERDGQTPPAPDDELLKLATQAEAEDLIAANLGERSTLSVWRDLQRKALEQTISSATGDLERARHRTADLEAALKSRQARLDALSTAENRGMLAPTSLAQARTELFEVEDRQEASRDLVAQLDQRLFQAQNDQEKLALERQIELARELKTVESEVTELEISVDSATHLAAAARANEQSAMQPSQAQFEILRRSSQGIQKIRASADTVLRPGDLLSVSRLAPGPPG